MSTVIAILTRSPADPRIKTRLTSVLPSDQARRELALAFIDDQVESAGRVAGVALRIAVTPPAEGLRMSRPQFVGEMFLGQRGASSADRQKNVLMDLSRSGFTNIVMMGSDLPDLPSDVLEKAARTLESDPSAVVLGPSHDGGYYLLGLHIGADPVPDLFSTLRFSTPREVDDMEAAVTRAGRTLLRLATWRDVDVAEDLTALTDRLRATPGAAPHTTAVLRRLGLF